MNNLQRCGDVLRGGSRARLARYRHNLEESLKRIRACRTPDEANKFIEQSGYTSPLNHRYSWMGDTAHGARFAPGCDSVSLPATVADGFRDVGDAHDIVRMKHTGWFKDAHYSETICGHVWQLPARNGEPVYLAGYEDKDACYIVLEVNGKRFATYDDKEDAARAADGLAEKDAETEREYNERWHAARELEDTAADQREALSAARGVVSGRIVVLRALACGSEAWNIAAGMVADAREDFNTALAALIETRQTLANDFGDIEL